MMTVADEEKSLPKRLAIFQRSVNFLKEIFAYITKNLFYQEVSYGNSQRFLPGQVDKEKT